MSDRDERVRMQVHPEPTDEEMAAIIAAVTALVSGSGVEEPSRDTGGGRERWALAGRRELLQQFDREESV